MSSPKLSIVIVHYKQPDHLAKCFQSLSRCRLPEGTQIFVVDNGYTNRETLEHICFSSAVSSRLIVNSTNLGLARAANEAVKFVSSKYILNLNPDVQIYENSIEELVRFMDNNPRTGVAFPKLLNADMTLQHSCRTHYNLLTILLRRSFFRKIYNGPRVRAHLMTDWDHEETREIDWGLGAAFLARRSALENGCLFDNRYFLYMEDVDLCLTMSKRGWKVYYVPLAVMVHHHQQQSRTLPWRRANPICDKKHEDGKDHVQQKEAVFNKFSAFFQHRRSP